MPYKAEAYVARGVADQLMKVETVYLKDLEYGEILVEPVAVSLCLTDLAMAKGLYTHQHPFPFIPGQECSGYVKAAGPGVTSLMPGDAVVLTYASCRECRFCTQGRPSACNLRHLFNFTGVRLDGQPAATDADGQPIKALFMGHGSLSTLVIAYAGSAVKVRPKTKTELQYFSALASEIQAGAGAVLNIAKLPPHSSVAVWGANATGIAALLAAALTSPSHLILVDSSASALDKVSADIAPKKICSDPSARIQTITKIMEITTGRGVDLAIDTLGETHTLRNAQRALAAGGTLIGMAGSEMASYELDVARLVQRGAKFVGTYRGETEPQTFIPYLIDMWKNAKEAKEDKEAKEGSRAFGMFICPLTREHQPHADDAIISTLCEAGFPFQRLLAAYSFDDVIRAYQDLQLDQCLKPLILFDLMCN